MYSAQFFTGDYDARQRAANAARCVAYVEQHFNSCEPPGAGSYALAIVAANASQTSRSWGRWYAQAIAREFGIGVGCGDGLAVGGLGGRGDFNLRYTAMPAILLEPLFACNPDHAGLIRSDDGQRRLAAVLVESIQRFFPGGGTVALSVGHKGKTSHPADRGAVVVGGGTEAEFAEAVLVKASTLLATIGPKPNTKTVTVMAGKEVLFERAFEATASFDWYPDAGQLRIS